MTSGHQAGYKSVADTGAVGSVASYKVPPTSMDKMVGGHHRLSGHEFEQTLGNSEGQGSLECCSPWRHNRATKQEQQQTDPHM